MSDGKEYWFARRHPLKTMRGGMAPVHWKGWLVALGFLLALGAGVLAWWWFAGHENVVRGVFTFAVVAGVAALIFIRVAHVKGDHINCVADYRKGKLSA